MASRSPFLLNYPGGKARASPILMNLLPHGTSHMVSPFFGGGSFEIAAALSGVRISGYDAFPSLVDFWQAVLNTDERGAVCDEIIRIASIYRHGGLKKYYGEVKAGLPDSIAGLPERYQRAAVFFVYNKLSFSGLMQGMADMKDAHAPQTIRHAERIRAYPLTEKDMKVSLLDYKKSMDKHRDELFYLDPPYALPDDGKSLYGFKGHMHNTFDDEEFLRYIKDFDKWILSYNDCEMARDMFAGYKIMSPEWSYSIRGQSNLTSVELIILSKTVEEELPQSAILQPPKHKIPTKGREDRKPVKGGFF